MAAGSRERLPHRLWARRRGRSNRPDTAAQIAGSQPNSPAPALVCLCVVGDAEFTKCTGRPAYSRGWNAAVSSRYTARPSDTCRDLAARASEQGVSVVDAPVSGGGPPRPRAPCWSWSAVTRTSSRGSDRFSPVRRPDHSPGPRRFRTTHQVAQQPVVPPPTWRTARTRLALGEALGGCSAEPRRGHHRGLANSYGLGSIARFGGKLGCAQAGRVRTTAQGPEPGCRHRREGRRRPGAVSRCRRRGAGTDGQSAGRTRSTGPTPCNDKVHESDTV